MTSNLQVVNQSITYSICRVVLFLYFCRNDLNLQDNIANLILKYLFLRYILLAESDNFSLRAGEGDKLSHCRSEVLAENGNFSFWGQNDRLYCMIINLKDCILSTVN